MTPTASCGRYSSTVAVRPGCHRKKLAAKLGRAQIFVSKIELGERRLDLIELLVWAEAMDLDSREVIERLRKKVRRKPR